MTFRLLDAFRSVFAGHVYRHRRANQGDFVAAQLYEDLLDHSRVGGLVERMRQGLRIVNGGNRRVGVRARRGDGTFGEGPPGIAPVTVPNFRVPRGPLATIEIGVEVKILAKAMIKQIDRVIGDLKKQVDEFRRGGGDPVTVALVGINHAEIAVGYEGRRKTTTNGSLHKHPIQEAAEAERRLREGLVGVYSELAILRFRATNMRPYPFEWVNRETTEREYGAALTRVSRAYEERFLRS